MPTFEFKCPLCGERCEDTTPERVGDPCVNRSCEGVLKRVYSLYIKPVDGGGGSPGRRVSQ